MCCFVKKSKSCCANIKAIRRVKRYILSSSLIGNGTLRECSLLFSKWKEIYVVFPNDRNTLFEIIDNNDYEEVKIEECKDLNILIDDFNQKSQY